MTSGFALYSECMSSTALPLYSGFGINLEMCESESMKRDEGVFGFRANMPFQQTQHLGNPWNENKKLQICRDGQVSEGHTGVIRSQLCTHQSIVSFFWNKNILNCFWINSHRLPLTPALIEPPPS